MKYKTYALTLKERYQKFETESQRHYANIIKKQQKVTDDMLKNKEDMLYELEQNNRKAVDDLNLMKAKMYKAQQDGVSFIYNYYNYFTVRNLRKGKKKSTWRPMRRSWP